ncbi:uncharacterized protein TRIADDRAFT_59734 [Trichoplax adhaerens]|uniref:Uncharacterized protein n=1 Tax=Trichoplax adhaerens TaxID=10228 RepID=B3S6A3_TRIAD|nr:predicted protein [Trichoplax adhaerens]EDV21588.1 predicted protein [Trichoplax adhaerens]|eukprot:XP_002115736.1 predicted protein [Trichoplax adhaerens]
MTTSTLGATNMGYNRDYINKHDAERYLAYESRGDATQVNSRENLRTERTSPRDTVKKNKPVNLTFDPFTKSTEDLHINPKTPEVKPIDYQEMESAPTINGKTIQFSLPKNIANERYSFLYHPQLSSSQRYKLWSIATMYNVQPLRDTKRKLYEQQKNLSLKEIEIKKKMLLQIEERQGVHKSTSTIPSRIVSAQVTGHRRAETLPKPRRPHTSPPRTSTSRQQDSMKKFMQRLNSARSNEFRQNIAAAAKETNRRELPDINDSGSMLSARNRSDITLSQRSRANSYRNRNGSYMQRDRSASQRNRSKQADDSTKKSENNEDTISQNLDVLAEYRAPDAPWASADTVSIAESMSLGGDRVLSHFADTLSLGGDRVIGNQDSISLTGDLPTGRGMHSETVSRDQETDVTAAGHSTSVENRVDKEGDDISIGTPSISEGMLEEPKKVTLGFTTEEETILEEGATDFDVVRKRRAQTTIENSIRRADSNASMSGRAKSGSFSTSIKNSQSSTSISSDDSFHKALRASSEDPGDTFFTNRQDARAGDGFWGRMAQEKKDTLSVFGNSETLT